MIKNFSLILIGISLLGCYNKSEKKTTADSSKKGYLKVLYEQCADADIIEVETTREGYTEVEYLCDGKRFEIGIKDNKLMFSEYDMEEKDLPMDKIQSKLDKKYPGWLIDEFSQVEANNTSFIKVEILKEGIEQNIYFTTDGKWYKMKPVDISSTVKAELIENNSLYSSLKYNFQKPDSVYEMPDLLREISGIALANNESAYCIQDELGSIFTYSFSEKEITNSLRFTDIGDFEDIAINGNKIYVLRSDGNLIVYDLANKKIINQVMLQTNALNVEGIFYKDAYLYIVCKEALITGSEYERIVYRTSSNNLNKTEVFLTIDLVELFDFIQMNYPELKISEFLFNPSAVAIHPETNEMYILSASDRFLAIFKDKQLKNIIPLSADIYYKPEGLFFFQNGDLLISSEGDKKGFVKGSINLLHQKK